MSAELIIEKLASNSPSVLQAVIIFALASVVVYQWKYTKDKTVPKEIFDKQEEKFDKLSDAMNQGFKTIGEVVNKIAIVVDERLKRK